MPCADACLYQDCDTDSNEFYVEATVRKSRKPHRCCECRDTIPAGEGYQRATAKSDGVVWSRVTCLLCVQIRKAFCCDGWVFGALREDMCEQLFPAWAISGPWDCLAKIETREARDKAARWFEAWRDGVAA